MGKAANRPKRYDMAPLVKLMKTAVRFNGGLERLKIADITEQTYYGRNRTPDKYQIGELRRMMIAYGIPKEEILDAVDKALTG